MGLKEKNIYRFSFISVYFFVVLFLLEEYIRVNKINLVLVVLFFYQNVVLFLSMLIEKKKHEDQ